MSEKLLEGIRRSRRCQLWCGPVGSASARIAVRTQTSWPPLARQAFSAFVTKTSQKKRGRALSKAVRELSHADFAVQGGHALAQGWLAVEQPHDSLPFQAVGAEGLVN